MMHERYYVEAARQEELLSRKNRKTDFYNGIFDRYEYPVLTREHIPLTWRYDLNPKTTPYFMERLGINAVMNSGAIELNGKYYLVARIEGNDRKSFFGVAESDNGIDGFRFWDYPILQRIPARKRPMYMICVLPNMKTVISMACSVRKARIHQ